MFHCELAFVHLVFHVSMLKKCIGDFDSDLSIKDLGVQNNLCDEEIPLQILYRQVNILRNKEVTSVKVLWKNHLVDGATWEAEADKKSRSPHLFDT